MNPPAALIEVRPHVAEAVAAGHPVVALETAFMTHGLPHPAGLDTARDCERIVREGGAVPASVGVSKGKLVVGLTDAELAALANANQLHKANLGNLAVVVGKEGYGGTSVSTTILGAHRAGIYVAATGGIGGVHRRFGETLDISSDMTSLERHPICLVCAGAKSILDVPATREQLETRGVPVVGYQTDHFPLFFCRGGSIPIDCRVETAQEVAKLFRSHRHLAMDTAMLVVADPPGESALDPQLVESMLDEIIADADHRQIAGRDLTPFILDRIRSRTEGESLRANLDLIRNNCQIAASIAAALAGGAVY